jgi:predicted RNA-binding Zn-ribbon protein involved in translation (DUF1610 family)
MPENHNSLAGRLLTQCPNCGIAFDVVLADLDFEYNDEYPEENGIFVTSARIATKCPNCGHYIDVKIKELRDVE